MSLHVALVVQLSSVNIFFHMCFMYIQSISDFSFVLLIMNFLNYFLNSEIYVKRNIRKIYVKFQCVLILHELFNFAAIKISFLVYILRV